MFGLRAPQLSQDELDEIQRRTVADVARPRDDSRAISEAFTGLAEDAPEAAPEGPAPSVDLGVVRPEPMHFSDAGTFRDRPSVRGALDFRRAGSFQQGRAPATPRAPANPTSPAGAAVVPTAPPAASAGNATPDPAPAAGAPPGLTDEEETIAAIGRSPLPDASASGLEDDEDAAIKSAKNRSADAYGATADEQQAMQRARHGDAQRDRRRRAMSTAGSILGALGGINPIFGMLGRVSNAGAAGVRESNLAETQQGQIDRRLAATAGQRRDEDAASTAQRQSAMDALAGRQAEANIGLTNQRQASLVSEDEREGVQAQLDEAARSGNVNAARATLRAQINAIEDPATRAAWQAELDTMLASEDPDQLLNQTSRAAATDVGHARSGTSGGTSGRMVQDPLTGAFHRAAGHGPAASPTTPAGTAPAASPARPRRPVPALGADAAAVPAPDARLVALNNVFPGMSPAERTIAQRSMLQHRYTPEQLADPRVQTVVNAAVEGYRGAPAARQEALMREAEGTLARSIDDREVSGAITDRTAYGNAAERMNAINRDLIRPYRQARIAVERALRDGVSESDMRVALAGGDQARRLASLRGHADLLAAIQEVREQYGRERSGAAIGASEWDNFHTILGSPSVLTPHASTDFIHAMQRLTNLGEQMQRSTALVDPGTNDPVEVYDEYMRQQRRMNAHRRGARRATP